MPMEGEVERKIKQLGEGKGVKAPYGYWHRVLIPETRKEYPHLSEERISAIAGKRWANISEPAKKKIIREWQPKARRIIRRTRTRHRRMR